jgi:dynein heavy chain
LCLNIYEHYEDYEQYEEFEHLCVFLSSKPKCEIQTLCTEAIKMLNTWKEAYYNTRLKIEQSGKGEWWEFDKKKLFKESDYIAAVAKDLFDITKV